jgi:hypothetical protein
VCASLSVLKYNKIPLNLQRISRRGQTEQKRERKFRVVRSLLAHVRTVVHRYVGNEGKIRNISRLSRLFTELWAGFDDGSSRPASTLRAVLTCVGRRDLASRFRYVFEYFRIHLFLFRTVSCTGPSFH